MIASAKKNKNISALKRNLFKRPVVCFVKSRAHQTVSDDKTFLKQVRNSALGRVTMRGHLGSLRMPNPQNLQRLLGVSNRVCASAKNRRKKANQNVFMVNKFFNGH